MDNLKPVALYDSLIKIRCGLTVLVALVVLMLGVMAIGNPARAEDKEKKRFVDNGDGTITDRRSGKMWEKKTDDGGIHDVNNLYNWTDPIDGDLTNPDGTAFTEFLNTLNTAPCFAGHCDWRLPKVSRDADENNPELEEIVDCSFGSPCIDPIFGPTGALPGVAEAYWSSTTNTNFPILAWFVQFGAGFLGDGEKILNKHVRAVRTRTGP